MPLSPNVRGSLYMAIAMATFAINDSVSKAAAQDMNVAQVMFLRALIASGLIAIIAWHRGALSSTAGLKNGAVGLRTIAEMVTTLLFLTGLANLPLGNVVSILQAVPLAVTMGAALVFGEMVGWRRWTSIIVGFIGVLVIVRPGVDAFNIYSLVVVGCVFASALRDLATKRIPANIPALQVSALTVFAVSAFGALLIQPMGGWTPPSAFHLLSLTVAAVFLLIGQQFLILAMRMGDVSIIAPFRYTALVWGLLLGFLVFNEIPDPLMIVGAAIIVASGLYTLYRERVASRSRSMAASGASVAAMTSDNRQDEGGDDSREA